MKIKLLVLSFILISQLVFSQEVEEIDEKDCDGGLKSKIFESEKGEAEIKADITKFLEGLDGYIYDIGEIEKLTLSKEVLKEMTEEYQIKKVIEPAKFRKKLKFEKIGIRWGIKTVGKKYGCHPRKVKTIDSFTGGLYFKREKVQDAVVEYITKERIVKKSVPEDYDKYVGNLVYCKVKKPEVIFKEDVKLEESDVEYAYKLKIFVDCPKGFESEKCVKSDKTGKVYVYKFGGSGGSGSGSKTTTKYKSEDGGATWQVIEEKVEKFSK